MRSLASLLLLCWPGICYAAEIESIVLRHYVPQDILEKAVRTQGWTEIALNFPGGVHKGYFVRVWAGGSVDWCNGDQPGENVALPCGPVRLPAGMDPRRLTLSQDPGNALAVLFKTDTAGIKKAAPPGKPLRLDFTRDKECLWIGFNDLQGRFMDNHLGKGRRHELDPLWVRVEVFHIIVD